MKKQAEEESGEKAPLWIISFADMISLLMAFFVMLQTMAAENTNDLATTGAEKLKATSTEFRRNIDGFGMPGLMGHFQNRGMKATQQKFKLEGDTQEVTDPASDGHIEKTRRLFTALSSQSTVSPSQFKGKQLQFEYAPITFDGPGHQLSDQAQKYLVDYAAILKQRDLEHATICIVSVCSDSAARQWETSELRAHAVAVFLRSHLPENCRHNVYWWGAGPAMEGVQSNSKPNVLIAVDTPSEI